MTTQNLSDRTSAKTSTFTSLTDTPATYAGNAGETLKVNIAEDAVGYETISTFSSAGNTPTIPAVNAFESGGAQPAGSYKFQGGVLMPNGKVFCVSYNYTGTSYIYNHKLMLLKVVVPSLLVVLSSEAVF